MAFFKFKKQKRHQRTDAEITLLRERWNDNDSAKEIYKQLLDGTPTDKISKQLFDDLTVPDPFRKVNPGRYDLRGITLARVANLPRPITFNNCNMDYSIINDCHLPHTTFHNCSALKANLSYNNFGSSNLQGCSFIECEFMSMKNFAVNVTRSSFRNCRLSGTNLEILTIDGWTWIGPKVGEELTPDLNLNLEMAHESYRQLKILYENSGLTAQAGYYYFRRRVCERKIKEQSLGIPVLSEISTGGVFKKSWYIFKSAFRFKRYFRRSYRGLIGLYLSEMVTGYGEKPLRILGIMIGFISLFAALFGNSEALESDSVERGCEYDIFQGFYFSILTFTSLGYGDFHPVNIYKALATLEALLGFFLLSLFIVVFARKMMRD